MFPVEFARRTIDSLCPPGGRILDPFCGRGTTPFVGQVTGRQSLGADVNPVAWLYAAVKLEPCADPKAIQDRVEDVIDGIQSADREAENDFQRLAWHPGVLAFLRSAKRLLDWKTTTIDRTLMGMILVHLHAKRGEGLSNQLRQSKAMSPLYAVRWWTQREMQAPEIDLRAFFLRKLNWRYRKGIPTKRALAEARLGDSRTAFADVNDFGADLILTSPPYSGVTNYEYDNWIRLWMLGGPPLPSYAFAPRYSHQMNYAAMLRGVFTEAKRLASDTVTTYVRTDARDFTMKTTVEILREMWPEHAFLCRYDKAPGATQTALFGNSWNKAGDLDLLLLPPGATAPEGFHLLRGGSSLTSS